MKNKEKKYIIDRYNERLKVYGYDQKTLGWSKEKHKLRFHVLLNFWDITNKEIMDFGCGFGDMYAFIGEEGYNPNYSGLDINEKLIEEGSKQYPQATLSTRDILIDGFEKSYDYIFSSGTHNTKIEDNWAFVEETFRLFDKYSRSGFALNFLSNKVDFQEEGAYYYDPAKMLSLAYNYSNRVVLRNDYMPFEFSIFVDKNNSFDKQRVVYPGYEKYM